MGSTTTGAVLGNMTCRDIGILGYGGVLPVVALLLGPAVLENANLRRAVRLAEACHLMTANPSLFH
jgi:hypothetical protein